MHRISFANISVTAGKNELLHYVDLLDSALRPSINPRKTVSASYQFIDVGLKQLSSAPSSVSYFGRIVKDTTILREQVFENGKLIPKRVVLPSSPSAFFIFNLMDHRMALLPETQGAPSVVTFGNTLKFYMLKAYETKVQKLYKSQNESETKTSFKSLKEAYPRPIIDIIPVADKVAIASFLKDFSVINQVVVKVSRRNQDLRHGELFDDLAEEVAPLGPSSSRFVINGGKDGLDREKTVDFVKDVVDHGYEDTIVTGQDFTGSKIKGSNQDYSLIRTVSDIPSDDISRAEMLFDQYSAAKQSGQIKVADRTGQEILERLDAIRNAHE